MSKVIIHISGSIAVGKTTLALALYNVFKKQRCNRVKRVHVVGLSGFTYWLSLVVLILHTRSLTILKALQRDVNTHPLTLLNKELTKRISMLITLIEFFTFPLFFLLKILIPLLWYNILIVEEGFINTLGGYLQIYKSFEAIRKSLFKIIIALFLYLNRKHSIVYVFIDNGDMDNITRWYRRKSFIFLKIIGIGHYIDFTNCIKASKKILLHRVLGLYQQTIVINNLIFEIYLNANMERATKIQRQKELKKY